MVVGLTQDHAKIFQIQGLSVGSDLEILHNIGHHFQKNKNVHVLFLHRLSQELRHVPDNDAFVVAQHL